MDFYDILYAKYLSKLNGGGSSVEVEPLSVTENGTYTAQSGKAYSPVQVNVSGGGLPNPVVSITLNYTATGIFQASINGYILNDGVLEEKQIAANPNDTDTGDLLAPYLSVQLGGNPAYGITLYELADIATITLSDAVNCAMDENLPILVVTDPTLPASVTINAVGS